MTTDVQTKTQIGFRLHPRVFEALGPRLVTNDIVAVIELVKNSYDAMATTVEVRFQHSGDPPIGSIEILDNGVGMTRKVIENVWAVVATPYRKDHPISRHKGRSRRVSGEKGLGRLSAARLGDRLELFTKADGEPCWELSVSWDDISNAETLETCVLNIDECASNPVGRAGTLLRMSRLRSEWPSEKIKDLEDQLSRLVSPFSGIEDFEIRFRSPYAESSEAVEIKPPDFLSYPPYKIDGSVDAKGCLRANYGYDSAHGERTEKIEEQLRFVAYEGALEKGGDVEIPSSACGPFRFEIRAWDLDTDSIAGIAERFDAKRSTITGAIRNYRGISLYRDGILVLPKTDSTRDWLGLDLRRVSRTGTRLSTSQLVGYVSITTMESPDLRDTSDRERLEENAASEDFARLMRQVVATLEDQRSKDRFEPTHREPPFIDLFAELHADDLLQNVRSKAEQGASATDVLPAIEKHKERLETSVEQIGRRLYYYSRLASLGTLSAIIVHEVRNHTTAMGELTRAARKLLDGGKGQADVQTKLELAELSIRSIERLADTFAPLASRATRTRRRDAIVEDGIAAALQLRGNDIKKLKVGVEWEPSRQTGVSVDPGELIAIVLNLLDNSLYWLGKSPETKRTIAFNVRAQRKFARVNIRVDDSGPGIPHGDEERIFWPGITRKADGLGMGLTVAAEIVAQYGGRLHLIKPGFLSGASFAFDLPMRKT